MGCFSCKAVHRGGPSAHQGRSLADLLQLGDGHEVGALLPGWLRPLLEACRHAGIKGEEELVAELARGVGLKMAKIPEFGSLCGYQSVAQACPSRCRPR
jgi:hypothetical protein